MIAEITRNIVTSEISNFPNFIYQAPPLGINNTTMQEEEIQGKESLSHPL